MNRAIILGLLLMGCGGGDDSSNPTSDILCDSCALIQSCYNRAAGACPGGYDVIKTNCNVMPAVLTIRCR